MAPINKIAAVVIWFNPTIEHINNILTYIEGVNKVYVIDNSNKDNSQLVTPNVEYTWLTQNMGIAYALNCGANKAYEAGYEWILTMDQDSCFFSQYIEQMLDILPKAENVGILAAVPGCSDFEQSEWCYVQTVFTSGNLVLLDAWKNSGGWCNELFIDSVDYEFNCRIIKMGYKIVQCNKVVFAHQLGNVIKHKLFATTNHNYIRRYYITRNRLYLKKWHNAEVGSNFKEFIKIILSEKDKIKKIVSIIRAYKDYKEGVLGRYRW